MDLGACQRIAVLRALQLGDMLCVVPALRAIRSAAPRARITLIGLSWAASFARRFARYIDDALLFPGFPGFPEQPVGLRAIPGFITAAQERRFDLVLQMHGSGTLSNPLAAALGATNTAGFYLPGQYCPDRQTFLPWDERENEILRYLRLAASLGAQAREAHLEFPLLGADRESLRQCAGTLPSRGAYACIHPGARSPSRRWLPQRFAEVADRLAAGGLRIVLTGTAQESAITGAVRDCMKAPALDLTGRTGLGALAALIADARLLVCNDTGVSHIAAAFATPSVVICCGADPVRWAPLDRQRHRVLGATVACRPCMHADCPLDGHPCAAGVSSDQAWNMAAALLEQGTGDRFSVGPDR
ncbi:MAG: ADP-heptose--LPS heptosyltransferase [Herminiimonas sp.]|nr:ADP-heptose--LPS heptosyltransferase [Herminiimonas sp.]